MAPDSTTPDKLIAINDSWTDEYRVPKLAPQDGDEFEEEEKEFFKRLKEDPLDVVSPGSPTLGFGILKFHLDLSRISSESTRLRIEEKVFTILQERCTQDGWVLLLCHDGPERFSPLAKKSSMELERFTLADFGGGSGAIYGRKGLVFLKQYYESEDDEDQLVAERENDGKSPVSFIIYKSENVQRVWDAYCTGQSSKKFLYDLHAQAILAQIVLSKKPDSFRDDPIFKRFKAQLEYLDTFLNDKPNSWLLKEYGLIDLSKFYSVKSFLGKLNLSSFFPNSGEWSFEKTADQESWFKSLETAIFNDK